MIEIDKQQQNNYTLQKLKEEFSNIEELGFGTYSTVYQAIHISSNLPVCLKVFEPSLPQHLTSNAFKTHNFVDESLELVENEVSIMKKLDHPFIAKYYGTIFIPAKLKENPLASTPILGNYIPFNKNDVAYKKNINSQIENVINQLESKEGKSTFDKSRINIRVNKNTDTSSDNTSKNGTYVIVMELVRGITLLDFINRFGKIDEQEACRIFAQIVDAFYYLQDSSINVVHRDVKLENIMLDENNNVRVIDFGFSKSLDDETHLLKTQCGSIPYASPELLQNSLYTKAVDVWSLGVLLFAMVNGCLPFEDTNMLNLANKIIYMTPKYADDNSQLCVDLISKMLEKNPNNRISLKKVKEHGWIKNNDDVVYDDEFIKRFQTKRHVEATSDKELKPSQSNCLMQPGQLSSQKLNPNFQNKTQSAGNIDLINDIDIEIGKVYLNSSTYVYDSLVLHETSKALQKTTQQIIDELNFYDMNDMKNDIHQMISLYKSDQNFKCACKTKMINRILENKGKSKKINILITLRMKNKQIQVLSNQEVGIKLPFLGSSPVKKKEMNAAFRVRKIGKQSNIVNMVSNSPNQAIKLTPKKKPINIFGKFKVKS